MGRYSYVGVLVFILVASGWLEVVLRTRVLVRWRRFLLATAPVLVAFVVWDVYAIAAGHWTFDPKLILGVSLPGDLPLDEVLFFATVPLASILTLEAVRAVKGWPVGDEAREPRRRTGQRPAGPR